MWNGEEIDLDAYFARTGYEGGTAPTLSTLRALHRAHTVGIPFENLDVALGRPVPLDVKSIQRKLVEQSRGGYCYEHNTLFAAVVERLGFEVVARGARNRTRGAVLPPVTHALLVVTVDGEQWLCDTGFGSQGPLEPVPLRDGAVVEQGGWTFGITAEDDGIHVLSSLRPEGWVGLYAFAPQRLYPADFAVMNHYSSSHPASKFVGQVVAQRRAPDVRRALVRDELTTTRTDGSVEQVTVPAGELGRVLTDVFGIVLTDDEVVRLAELGPGGSAGA
ncbi:arylamine N-acetyltransferase family protein [Streptomyces sp. BR1]|uniref:arylamine N-acetyltransferase family protein n=1 Tax=Streptomyces sp. BR1 TaxID=1592323 RepID=UPI00402B106D